MPSTFPFFVCVLLLLVSSQPCDIIFSLPPLFYRLNRIKEKEEKKKYTNCFWCCCCYCGQNECVAGRITTLRVLTTTGGTIIDHYYNNDGRVAAATTTVGTGVGVALLEVGSILTASVFHRSIVSINF